MYTSYLKNTNNGIHFFGKIAGRVSVTLPKMHSLASTFHGFLSNWCYLSKFGDILQKFFSQKNLVVAANRCKTTIVENTHSHKNYIFTTANQSLRKPKTFSISSWSLVVLKWQNLHFSFHAGEAYSESFQMSKTELFMENINSFQL